MDSAIFGKMLLYSNQAQLQPQMHFAVLWSRFILARLRLQLVKMAAPAPAPALAL